MIISHVLAPLALLAASQAAPNSIPGSYVAAGAQAQCRVVLMEPATRPQDSRMVTETVSGLAAVEPGCSLPIAGAGLWVLTHESGELALIGMTGEPLFAGTNAQAGWTGTTGAGEPLVLTRG